ncbi:MAG: response regulator [Saprospiraceae bacterium]|nr:response regulator [Saprospiraceae bacterium]
MANPLISNKGRLLLVEDDALLRDAISNLLRGEGYAVDEAAKGSDALDWLNRQTYNTVILDLVLPEPDVQGIDVLAQIKAEKSHLPVIAFSGKASNNIVLRTIELGVDTFLLKYLTDLDVLLDVVAKCVHKDKLTNNISQYLQDEGEYFNIKGITGDMHIYVMQYVMYFEMYLWRFKEIKARLSIFSDGNDVKVKFHSALSQERIFELFREYLSFTEQGLPAEGLFSQPVLAKDKQLLTRQLEEQIQHFTTSISQAFYLFSEKRKPGVHATGSEYALNISNIIKGLHPKRRDFAAEQLLQEAHSIVASASGLLMENNIIPAGHALMEFCHKYGLASLHESIAILLRKYDQTANEHLCGIITAGEYDRQLNQILNSFIFEVIPAVEQFPLSQRA